LGRCLPLQKNLILLFQISLLDWKCWKINVKSCSGPLKGPPFVLHSRTAVKFKSKSCVYKDVTANVTSCHFKYHAQVLWTVWELQKSFPNGVQIPAMQSILDQAKVNFGKLHVLQSQRLHLDCFGAHPFHEYIFIRHHCVVVLLRRSRRAHKHYFWSYQDEAFTYIGWTIKLVSFFFF
jgi:hypothetical protein